MNRSTEDVLDDHLREALDGSCESDLARNNHSDVVVLSAQGTQRGHDGVRTANDLLQRHLPDATYCYRTKVVDGDDLEETR